MIMPGEESANPNGVDPYLLFCHQHKTQLETGGVPAHYWPTLYEKLTKVGNNN